MGAQAAVASIGRARSESKAQAAIELLAYAAFFLFTFVAAVAVFFQLQAQEVSRAERSFAQELAFQLSDQINTAFIAGSGFSQSVQITPMLLGKPYTMTISRITGPTAKESGLVYVNWKGPSGQELTASALTVTAAYNLTPSANYISTDASNFIVVNSTIGTLNMTNKNGTIHFTKG
ncbi:MAG: hypothetical protein QW568_01390 [Candidatus Anstonellaceae archaeon]